MKPILVLMLVTLFSTIGCNTKNSKKQNLKQTLSLAKSEGDVIEILDECSCKWTTIVGEGIDTVIKKIDFKELDSINTHINIIEGDTLYYSAYYFNQSIGVDILYITLPPPHRLATKEDYEEIKSRCGRFGFLHENKSEQEKTANALHKIANDCGASVVQN